MSKKEKILIVDDEKIIRESLFHWFEEDGRSDRRQSWLSPLRILKSPDNS